jgi:hypothetical protein
MLKYTVVLLGIVVLLGAIGYVVLLPQEEVRESATVVEVPEGQVNFREYVNSELGFAISYPASWSYSRATAGLPAEDYTAILFSAPGVEPDPDNGVLPNIAVNYYKSLEVLFGFENLPYNGESLEEYMATSTVVDLPSPATLAGRRAWKGKVAGLAEGDVIDTVFVENGGHIYAVGVSNRTNFEPSIEEAMISSFKLTNEN